MIFKKSQDAKQRLLYARSMSSQRTAQHDVPVIVDAIGCTPNYLTASLNCDATANPNSSHVGNTSQPAVIRHRCSARLLGHAQAADSLPGAPTCSRPWNLSAQLRGLSSKAFSVSAAARPRKLSGKRVTLALIPAFSRAAAVTPQWLPAYRPSGRAGPRRQHAAAATRSA